MKYLCLFVIKVQIAKELEKDPVYDLYPCCLGPKAQSFK